MLRRLARQAFDRTPVFLQPLILVGIPVFLLHPLWTYGTADAGAREQPRNLAPTRHQEPIVPPELVRQSVEGDPSFGEIKKAMCPRRVPDRYEEMQRYPAIRILQGGEWATVTNDSSRGVYEKVIEITPAGRLELMNDLSEEGDQYVINIARRSYIRGSENESFGQAGTTEVVAGFRWQWQPLNNPGSRFTLEPYGRNGYGGRATFRRNDNNTWEMTDLWLEKDERNYLFAQ
ncbi:MAG TPA: hypothetical protein VLV78_16235 [Thermoanaerobaculia bacterium]|nr:hypothetical protein [Thermoanaerobaculia bacterium]